MSDSTDHDPTGHVIGGIGGEECSLCGREVFVAEWMPEGSAYPYRWRWEHTPVKPAFSPIHSKEATNGSQPLVRPVEPEAS